MIPKRHVEIKKEEKKKVFHVILKRITDKNSNDNYGVLRKAHFR